MGGKRYIVRVNSYPEPARTEKEILRMLDLLELKPTDEIYDEVTIGWRPLGEVEPFRSHLEQQRELEGLDPTAFAKRKQFRQPVRYALLGLTVLGLTVLAAFGVATIFNTFGESLDAFPDQSSGAAEPVWRFETSQPLVSGPAVLGDRIYFGGEDGYLYCVDAATGRGLWKHSTGAPVIGEVAAAAGRVFVGSCDNALWCFDAASGKRLWRFPTGYYVGGGVRYADGAVYFGSYDHCVYCVDAETGRERWRFETDGWVFSTPFVSDGRVYVGSFDGNFYCLDAADGKEQWHYEVKDAVYSSPYVWEGKVYFGADDSWLHCLDAATGKQLWRFRDREIWHYIRGRIVVCDGRVYFGCLNHKVYAVDARTGDELWFHETTNTVEAGGLVAGTLTDGRGFAVSQPETWVEGGGELPAEPEVREAHLYIPSANGSLYCLDAATGSLVWGFPARQHAIADPAWYRGLAVFPSADGNLYAVRTKAAEAAE